MVLNMEIIKVRPSGYCKGVIRAILKVKETINNYPNEQIYILGMLVHNRFVVQAFEKYHIITLNDPTKTKKQQIDEIEKGVIIFTAHGISAYLKQYAQEKGLITVDATCSDVTKNMELCYKYLSLGYDIIYIGKKKHPESEAVISIDEKIHLIENEKDLDDLNLTNDKLLITNQTTMSILDIQDLINSIKQRYPQVQLAEEICDATRQRQKAVYQLQDIDCVIVVGDISSNNTQQLANIALKKGIKKVLRIEKASDLLDHDLSDCQKVAFTSGASTPAYLTDQAINYLRSKEDCYLEINIDNILDL